MMGFIFLLITISLATVYSKRKRDRQKQRGIATNFLRSYAPDKICLIPPNASERAAPYKGKEHLSQTVCQKRKITFYLPLTIERLVMSVQSGLDIGPSIEKLVANGTSANTNNPCEELFSQVIALNTSGLTLEESLQEIANKSSLPVIKHTFSHLASAQRDGGEILRPLLELADATQQAYQEEMDEEIAKLPIKATLPLILTFSGLLICMMTPPILQVLSLIAKSHAGGG